MPPLCLLTRLRRLMHSVRCSPPAPQLDSFAAFDRLVRSTFSSLTGIHPSDLQWQQAMLAWMPVLPTSLPLGAYAQFVSADVLASQHTQSALTNLNHHLAQPLPLAVALTRRQLTKALDSHGGRNLNFAPLARRAILLSEVPAPFLWPVHMGPGSSNLPFSFASCAIA